MKKFQETLKQKAHLSKIKNAKTTITTSNRNIGKSNCSKASQQAKLLLSLYQNKSYEAIPAYKLLRTVGLQQYTRGFIIRGYGINLGLLRLMNQKEKEKLYEDLKILPGHAVKLDELISILAKNSYSNEYEYDNGSQKSVSCITKKSSLLPSRQSEIDYELQLQRVLNEYTSTPIQMKKKANNTFKVIQSKPSANSSTTQGEKSSKKNFISSSSSIKKGDSQKKPVQSSRTLKKSKIPQKIIKTNIQGQLFDPKKIMQIDLDLEKVKALNRSFDGALMSSTIANIDLEQLIYSFAGFIFSTIQPCPQPKVTQSYPNSSINRNNSTNNQIEDQVGQILRESYMHPLYRSNEVAQQIDGDEVVSQGENQQQQQTQSVKVSGQIGQSSFLGGVSYNFGISAPLKIFDQPNPVQIDYIKPTIDSIFNFIKNIVLAAKMQRQIPIMAASYIQCFLKISKVQMTSLNYKRILVSSLLLASKIWDDQSFQSPSFSKTFPQYTTVLLNEMEKQILNHLDYKLKLDKKQYAKIYFNLRKFRKNNYKSYQNRKLPLYKIRQLQNGQKKEYKSYFLTKRPSF